MTTALPLQGGPSPPRGRSTLICVPFLTPLLSGGQRLTRPCCPHRALRSQPSGDLGRVSDEVSWRERARPSGVKHSRSSCKFPQAGTYSLTVSWRLVLGGTKDVVLPRLVRRGHPARLGGPLGGRKPGRPIHGGRGVLRNSASPGGVCTGQSPQPGEPHRFEHLWLENIPIRKSSKRHTSVTGGLVHLAHPGPVLGSSDGSGEPGSGQGDGQLLRLGREDRPLLGSEVGAAGVPESPPGWPPSPSRRYPHPTHQNLEAVASGLQVAPSGAQVTSSGTWPLPIEPHGHSAWRGPRVTARGSAPATQPCEMRLLSSRRVLGPEHGCRQEAPRAPGRGFPGGRASLPSVPPPEEQGQMPTAGQTLSVPPFPAGCPRSGAFPPWPVLDPARGPATPRTAHVATSRSFPSTRFSKQEGQKSGTA